MFDILSGLVQEQAEMLNNIEHNMQEAKMFVDKGEKNIVLAKKWYQQTRTVLKWIMVIENVLHTSGTHRCRWNSSGCSINTQLSEPYLIYINIFRLPYMRHC